MVRFKNRYFVAEIETSDRPSHAPFEVSKFTLQSCILDKIRQTHGDFGLASVIAGFRIKYCNPYTKIILVRSRHGPHRFVATALPLINKVGGVRVQLNTLYVGGTMMKCFKFIRNHQLSTLEKFWNKMRTDNDRKQMKAALLNLNI